MFKDIKRVFYSIFFEVEKVPLTLLTITIILIIIITIFLVRKELKNKC